MRKPRFVLGLLLGAVLLPAAGCAPDDDPAKPEDDPAAWTTADPEPELVGDARPVSPAGEIIEHDGVTLRVPAAVSGSEVLVQETAEIGRHGDEWFGRPVHLEHEGALDKPVVVEWSTEDLTAEQAASAVLAHWDPELLTWVVSDQPLTLEGDVLVARLSDFSFWDVVADVGQGVGELIGGRAPAPTCRGRLPGWVDDTVDPDEDTSAAAIRVCFAPDKAERVTVRVVNNRSFTQRLTLSSTEGWAWTWRGKQGVGIETSIIDTARAVFDDETHFLLRPLHEHAVGVGRPAQAGSHVIKGTASVDAVTVLVDAVTFGVSQASIGGLDNPLFNAMLQATYECGGKQLLEDVPGDIDGVLRLVVDAIGSCAAEIVRPDSEFGARFEALAQEQIRKNPGHGAEDWAKANRLVHSVAGKLKILTLGQLAFYASDQLANASVGDLAWTIRGRGRSGDLGAWEATCQNLATDSNSLYRNLALRDEFADTSQELWEFDGWADAAAEAVAPVADCGPDYASDLADYLPTSWGDPVAAEVVADAIRALTGAQDVPGEETGRVDFDHPAWGHVTLITSMDLEAYQGYITVVDGAGRVVWDYATGDSQVWYEMQVNDPAIDGSGNVYLNWNPGRYNGVTALRPTEDGFEDFDTLPDEGDYNGLFYYAELLDVDGDGVLEIEQSANDCDPSCAGGTVTSEIYYWTGSGFEVG